MPSEEVMSIFRELSMRGGFDIILAKQRNLVRLRGDKRMASLLRALERSEGSEGSEGSGANGASDNGGRPLALVPLPEAQRRLQGALLVEQAMALVREVSEFLSENPYTKRWVGGGHPPIDDDAALAELADIGIFWINLVLLSGYSARQLSSAMEEKFAKNERRAANFQAGLGWQDGAGVRSGDASDVSDASHTSHTNDVSSTRQEEIDDV